MRRREFLKCAALSVGTATGLAQARLPVRVSLVVSPEDPVVASAPVQWAVQELELALTRRGNPVTRFRSVKQTPKEHLCIVPMTRPGRPESLTIAVVKQSGREIVQASGSDPRGLMYALLELADGPIRPVSEQPANAVRSVSRLFVSDVEDKPWFNDREMWPAYFTMLAKQRFNRFHLALGIGYDFLREVTDAYFLFAYPFFLNVPGYNVRAVNLPDSERVRNLETLKFISEQAALRGLDFHLGLWTHGYQWTNSPRANYTIEGLTSANHAEYCRDALTALLKACPAITGVTLRIHGESGVAEGSYAFWQTVFDGVRRCGRTVEIDLHSKGIDQTMIDGALATGMPVKVSPKFWAEHMGLPYHQAAIRDLEMPRAGRSDQGFFALSSGSRSFTRYGYADLLREDRRYGVVHRIWPGTQRLLLWNDPKFAAAYSRAFQFCGSNGVDWMEPLSFKGRRGSGIAGDRCGYADASLRPRWDWQKYLSTYRVLGRAFYNPASPVPAASPGLALVSRILPLITTAHGPSAANNSYWPEMYTNQPIVDSRKRHQYGDSPSPKVFGNVSPFDPQLFSRITDFADELLKGERSGKYSPVEVAQWLEDLAQAALREMGRIERRIAIDVRIQAGLGRFFAAKFRTGVLYAIHERTGDRVALEEALKAYRGARARWSDLAEQARGVYLPDITVGEQAWLRGHWLDRLPAIDEDIADMAKRMESARAADDPRVRAAVREALGRPVRERVACRHAAPARFQPGQRLSIELFPERKVTSARLLYRHVNQAERYESADMAAEQNRYLATIPGAYTLSPYPLQYYFELRKGPEQAWLYPGFDWDAGDYQPYFVVRQ